MPSWLSAMPAATALFIVLFGLGMGFAVYLVDPGNDQPTLKQNLKVVPMVLVALLLVLTGGSVLQEYIAQVM